MVKKILENDRLKRPMTINKNRHITRHIIVKCQKLMTGEIFYRLLKIFFKFISNQKSFGFLKINTGSKTNNEAKPLKLWKKNTCKVEQTIIEQLSMFRHSWFQKCISHTSFLLGKTWLCMSTKSHQSVWKHYMLFKRQTVQRCHHQEPHSPYTGFLTQSRMPEGL